MTLITINIFFAVLGLVFLALTITNDLVQSMAEMHKNIDKKRKTLIGVRVTSNFSKIKKFDSY